MSRWVEAAGLPQLAFCRLRGGPLCPCLILLLMSLLLSAACQPTTLVGPEIRLNLGSDPPTIDPLQVTDPPTIQVIHLLFLNLVNLRESDGAPIAALATDWLVSSDGLSWEFHLRANATWVQNNPVTNRPTQIRNLTAEDVVYSVRRVFDPRASSSFASLFAPLVQNAEALAHADPRTRPEDLARLADSVGIEAPDEHTVRFHLTRPESSFPAVVATWLGRVVPREQVEKYGLDWTDPATLWTSGPYLLERWDHNRELILRKNQSYYDAGGVQIDRVRFEMYPDVGSALDAYLSGNLESTDPFGSITGDLLERVNQDPALSGDAQIIPSLCTQYVGLNASQPPFQDVRVRQAFALSVNRADLVGRLKNGDTARWFAHPAALAAPPISDTLGFSYNPNQAKVLLDQAGYGTGKKTLPEVTFGFNLNDTTESVALALAENWKRTLGAQVKIEEKGLNEYLQELGGNAYGIFRLGYCASYPDASSFYADRSPAGLPYPFLHWSDGRMDQLAGAAARSNDLVERRELYRAIEKILVQDQAVLIPLAWGTRVALTSRKIERSFAVMEGYDAIEKWRVKTP